MRRFHMFEWEDQPWLPAVFRDFITDHLRYTLNEPMRHPVNVEIAQRLRSLLDKSPSRSIVDLCAGAGGPLLKIAPMLTDPVKGPVDITLTDLYPNVATFSMVEAESNGQIKGRYESISAMAVPDALSGVRTLFTSLHHFKPAQVRMILADAVHKRAPIAVFEPLDRSFRMLALLGVVSFIRGFTHTPRVGALTVRRLLFTYVIPLAPLLFAWDGMVSVLRSYTPEELRAITGSVPGEGYRWEVGRFEVSGPYGPMPTTYLLGTPARILGEAGRRQKGTAPRYTGERLLE